MSHAYRRILRRVQIAFVTTILAALPWASAQAAPLVFNTGVDASGTPMSGSAVDPHYQIINSAAFGPQAYAVRESDGAPLVPGVWLLDNSLSAWLVPVAGIFFVDQPGVTDVITYRTTFNLTGYDPNGRIDGQWAADDSGLQILINGVAVPGVGTAQLDLWTPFSITSGFVAGLNTLDFQTRSTQTPTGLRVEMNDRFVALKVSEPASTASVALALMLLAAARQRVVKRGA